MNWGFGTIIPLAACVVYVLLIVLAARQGLDRRVNQLFIWYAFLLMLWSFGSFIWHAYPLDVNILFWNRFLIVSGVFSSVAMFHFVRVFLGKSQPVAWLSLGYGLCALFAVLTIMGYTLKSVSYVDGVLHQEMGLAMLVLSPVAFIFGGAAVFNLVQGYRKEKDPFARNRIAYPLAGVWIALVLGLASNVVSGLRGYPIDHSGNLINAALLSYAILRYKLLDIQIVFKGGLRYALQSLILAGVLVLAGGAWFAANGVLDLMSWSRAVGIAILFAIALQLLIRLMRRPISGLFAGEHSDYRHMLRSTSRALSAMPELEDQASWLMDNLMQTVEAEKGGLFLLDEEQKRYLPRALRGYDAPAMSQMHLERDNPAVAFLAKADRCLTAEDLERVPQLRAMWKLEREQLEELETRVLVPVRVKYNLIGVILLGPKRSQKMYTVDELELIYTVANQAAVTIENTRLYQEAKDRAEWIEMISRLTRAIGSSLAMEKVYETFTTALKNLVDFDRISISRVEGDTLRFLVVSSDGPMELSTGVTIPLKKSVAAWVIAHKCAHIENDFAERRQFPADESLVRDGFRSAIRVPLYSKGEVFGTLNLTNRRPNAYGEREQKILEQIAGQLAVAIQNAQLYEEAKQAYEEARQAYEELNAAQEYMVRSEKLRALGEMAGGVAHDFNNVLSVILGRAQLVLEDLEDPKLRKSVTAIEQAALDAAKTVRRLQDFTRVRRDQVFDQVKVNQLVRSSLQMAEPRFAERRQRDGVEIDVGIEVNAANSVRGDVSELREALLNIIFNAVDSMPQGGKINIKAWKEENEVVLSIADTGAGIPEEVKTKIFDPFFTTKGPNGMGLGLSITYGIITRHGGSIEVDSILGQGSTFYVKLPVEDGEMDQKFSPDLPDSTGKANILLVDDDPEVSEVLELMLAQMGHRVAVVAQGAVAIALFEQGDYDLVITDLGMPDISGWEVAKAVKEKSQRTPVILITGWGVQLDSEEMIRSGVDGVIAKPFSKESLMGQLARLLER